MPFGLNLAGAAAGAQDALAEALKQRLLQEESDQRNRQLAGQEEDRATNRRIQQQNADSLELTRQAQVDAKNRETQRVELMNSWSRNILANPEGASELDLARAHNIQNFGEDLPPEVIASHLKKPTPKASKLLTPEELQQHKDIVESDARTRARFQRPPAGDRTDARNAEKKSALDNVQGYLGFLRKKYPTPEGALKEFDFNIPLVIDKAQGHMAPAAARDLLLRLYRAPMTPQQEAAAARADLLKQIAGKAATVEGEGK